jgi:hypothetical protein
MQKWEYLFVETCHSVIKKKEVTIVSEVNNQDADFKNPILLLEYSSQLGQAGWELAGVWGQWGNKLIFKRPIP